MADQKRFNGTVTFNGAVQCTNDFKSPNSAGVLGTELANNTDAVTFTTADHGKTFLCALSNAAKTVNLPASMTTADVGTTITIVQKAQLGTSATLTINANTGNIFSATSAVGNVAHAAVVPNGSSDNRLAITGHDTNSALGAGSRIVATVIRAGVWHLEFFLIPVGTGKDAFAFSAV